METINICGRAVSVDYDSAQLIERHMEVII